MEILVLLIFFSLFLAFGSVGFFVWVVRSGSADHTDRLALLPLESDQTRRASQQSRFDGSNEDPFTHRQQTSSE